MGMLSNVGSQGKDKELRTNVLNNKRTMWNRLDMRRINVMIEDEAMASAKLSQTQTAQPTIEEAELNGNEDEATASAVLSPIQEAQPTIVKAKPSSLKTT